MKINVGILGTGSYLPEQILTNEQAAREKLGRPEKKLETFSKAVQKQCGIKERRIAARQENTSDLAAKAAKRALKNAQLEPKDITYVFVATDTHDFITPGTCPYILKKLGMHSISATDVSGACAGFTKAIELACDRITARGKKQKILIIGAELISRQIKWTEETKSYATLFGDGASAAILGVSKDTPKILTTYDRMDGRLADILYRPHGGTHSPDGDIRELNFESGKIKDAGVEKMAEAVKAVCDKAHKKIQDVDWLIPHQANLRMIESIAEMLEFPIEKVLVNITKYANTGSATIGKVLDDCLRSQRFKKGDKIVLSAFGAGIAWGGALLQF